MNKKEFIEKAIGENKKAFGRWHSTQKPKSADPAKIICDRTPPQTEEESRQYGNALANTGNYPVGLSGCFCVGISGGCGPDCYVYQDGECGEPQEMIPRLETEEEKARHAELYPEQIFQKEEGK